MNVLKTLPLKNINHFTRHFHKSTAHNALKDFFDIEKNWGTTEVKSGRAWNIPELRIKSNTDLHKLWYVLLKERNMLLTMEEESKQQTRLFPSPERIDKVEISMENIETVVKERNVAYHMLETGQPGIRSTETVTSALGHQVEHTTEEYLIPKEQNTEWLKEHTCDEDSKDVYWFRKMLKEKENKQKRQQEARDLNHVIGLLKRFPKMDMAAVREQYPNVDIEKAKRSYKARGHSVPEMYNFKE